MYGYNQSSGDPGPELFAPVEGAAHISEHMEDLHRLASYLLEEETITGEKFMKLLNRT